ncbi:phosphate ABC transporter permease subunit PstC [Planctomycetaceae bacterium SH139]
MSSPVNQQIAVLDQSVQAVFTAPRRSLRGTRARELSIYVVLIACAAFSVFITVAILGVLLKETVTFFQSPDVSLGNFLGSTTWNPRLGGSRSFGIWALISGTTLITVIAMLIALPLGLITAVYLSEFAPRKVRAVLKPVLEILAGIPTVVYGFFALTTITPFLQWIDDGFNIYNAMAAGIAVGILCLPTVCSLSEDALRAVPGSLREAAYGLGGTRFDVAVKVVVPAALSGIISAFLLAAARAIGETMIVSLAAGSRARVTFDPRDDIQTMTGYMVQMATGDVSTFDLAYYSLYAVAFTLFLMTLSLTMVGNVVRKRFREKYE